MNIRLIALGRITVTVRVFIVLCVILSIVGVSGITRLTESACAGPRDDKSTGDKQPAEPQASDGEDAANRKAQMAAMRRIAEGVSVTVSDDAQGQLELFPEALFRSYDPAREQTDGTIWAYGKKGRPAALLTLSLHPRGDGTLGWLYEFNSLTHRPVSAKVPGHIAWSTRQVGLEVKPIPDAPPAAEKEVGRTRQFRDLSARFTGYEMLVKGPNAPAEHFELRLIPRPIHRYSDPDRGLVDGAIFLFTHSTNPEIIMLIELVREGEKSVWKSGFARCAFAEVHVELDGKKLWTQPHLQGTPATDPYWLFFKPIPGGRLDEE